MQEEKQNKQIRSAIEDLQELPGGFAFNSQRVWAGLEQQLPSVKKNNTKFYFAAAAVVLIAGTVYFGVIKNNVTQTLNTPIITGSTWQPKQIVSPIIHQSKIQQQHNLATISPTAKRKADQQTNNVSNEPKENTGEIIESAHIPEPVEQVAVILPLVAEPQKQEPKKLPAITVSKPAPKKYKVIHINELNTVSVAPDQQNTISRYEFKKTMQLQNEEKETVLPPDNNTKQILFFKLKPSTTTTTIVEN